MDPIQDLDWGTYYWFRWFRTKRGLETATLDGPMTMLDSLGSPLFLGILAVLIVLALLRERNRRGALAFTGSVVAACGAILALRLLISRRPASNEPASLVAHGFPSQAAMLSSLIIGVLFLLLIPWLRRTGARVAAAALAVGAVLAIGTSQLYLGHQFLTDVLAGWAGGTFLVLLGDRLGWYS